MMPMMRGTQYRQSLPGSSTSTLTTSVLPSVPPVAPATRKRKREVAAEVVSYREEQYLDNTTGKLKNVIVIDDSPEPPPSTTMATSATLSAVVQNGFNHTRNNITLATQRRTRAQVAAAAAAAQSANQSAASSIVPPPAKRRKRELQPQYQTVATATTAATQPALVRQKNYPTLQAKPWPSTSAATDVSVVSSAVSKAPPACDDKEGHYVVTQDDIIGGRYRIVRLLGQGTFGKVVEATHLSSQRKVAVKIIRAIPKYREASNIEIRVLKLLRERDPANRQKCIHLIETFDHRNHVCIVTELLGMCVYDFLKENEFHPFPRSHIQQFARQLLSSVAFLHDLQLIHTDLKPENILLVNNAYSVVEEQIPSAHGKRPAIRKRRILHDCEIRLIDFGSATFEREYHSTVVSTRHYRAPEIILALGWSYECDAFSLGCILVEFYTGVALYQTHDNLEHLAMMEMVMGRMPDRFSRKGAAQKAEYFKDNYKLDWPPAKATKQSKKDVRSTKGLEQIIVPVDNYNRAFLDLVRKLLGFDPADRIRVRDALEHPYFSTPPPNDYT